MRHALVVLSGGQDSATCLAWAKKGPERAQAVSAISFVYGQRHQVELDCARYLAGAFEVDVHRIVDVSFIGNIVTSALTGNGDVNANHPFHQKLPASFVPNRNALFLTIAHAFAQQICADTIIAGMNQTDYSGYPDCRATFLWEMQEALNKGSEARIHIVTPLIDLTKAETFMLAQDLGVLDIIIHHTHTCYNGDHINLHPWGYGCGNCPACKLRKNGFEEFQARDLPL